MLEAVADDAGLVRVWDTLATVANTRSRFAEWAGAGEQALAHERRAALPGLHSYGISVGLALGPLPASEALATLDALLPELRYPGDAMVRALLLAMLDRMEEARAVALAAEERTRELGHTFEAAWLAEVALLSGDPPAAADYFAAACEAQAKSGSAGTLASSSWRLGQILCRLGRVDEAEPRAEAARRLADDDDVSAQAGWRQALALVAVARGNLADAERLAREAVSWTRRSDSPLMQGDALNDLAEVLDAAGKRAEAVGAWQEALDQYERKEVFPLARRVRERLAALEPV